MCSSQTMVSSEKDVLSRDRILHRSVQGSLKGAGPWVSPRTAGRPVSEAVSLDMTGKAKCLRRISFNSRRSE